MFTMRFFDSLFRQDREAVRRDTDAAAAWFEEFKPVLPPSWRAEDAKGRPAPDSDHVPRAYCG